MAARGIRNNNPGNLVHGYAWSGLAAEQTDSTFAQFVSMPYGLRALLLNLRGYFTVHNVRTVREIISRWAPPADNNPTATYINAVAAALNVDPDRQLEPTPKTLERLARAIVAFEVGPDANKVREQDWMAALGMVLGPQGSAGVGESIGAPAQTPAPRPAPTVPPRPSVFDDDAALPVRGSGGAMSLPVFNALLPVIRAAIPELGRVLGDGSERDQKREALATVVTDLLTTATKATNLQQAVERVQTDPEARVAAQAAVRERYYELVSQDASPGIVAARQALLEAGGKEPWFRIGYGVIVALLAVLVVTGGGYVLWQLVQSPATPPEQKGMLVGALVSFISIVLAFFFGSSVGSKSSGDAVRRLAERNPGAPK